MGAGGGVWPNVLINLNNFNVTRDELLSLLGIVCCHIHFLFYRLPR